MTAMRGLVVAGMLAWVGCLESPATECADNLVCAADKVCDPSQRGCVFPEQLDCAGQADESACSYEGVADGACFEGVCRPAGCGNGELEEGEACDDGNRVHGDGCAADCLSDESCGNNVVDATVGEACDDGAQCQSLCDDGTACAGDADCEGIGDETCTAGDSCEDDADCAGIGDGLCKPREGDGCQANCASPTCGDGVIDRQFNEVCDDGGDNSEDADAACRTNCQPQRCGDGIEDIGSGEGCDDGNVNAGDGCTAACVVEECGNGQLDVVDIDGRLVPAEGCDDGENGLSGDGCAALCEVETAAWREHVIPFPGSPPSRSFYDIAYDAGRGRTVVFGGDVAVGGPGSNPRETFEWDGTSWINMTPPGASPPADLDFYRMTYDAARRQVVLFGGDLPGGLSRDTWLWDGDSWQRRTPAVSPSQRARHDMAYDAAREVVVLFGGVGCNEAFFDCDDSPGPPMALDETWEWNGSEWKNVSPPAGQPTPGARDEHVMTYDAARGVVVLIGGSTDGSTAADVLWSWDGTAWTEHDPAPVFVGTNEPIFVYDAARELVVLGGAVWDGVAWSTETVNGTLNITRETKSIYDIARDRTVTFNGDSTFPRTFERSGDTYSEVTPIDFDPDFDPLPIPSAREGHAMSFDGTGVILFGGEDSAGATLADTWRFDGLRWTQLSPATPPSARRDHVMAYDSSRRLVILHGAGETFAWDGDDWSAAVGGPSLVRPSMAYDANRDRMVLVGDTTVTADFPGETHEWNGTSWTRVSTEGPLSREGHAVAYDASRGVVVLFGGRIKKSGFGGALMNDETWEWDGAAWAQIETVVAPAAREGHIMFYDAARQQVILVGGRDCTSLTECSPFDDVWAWDGTAWTPIAAGPSPSRRALLAGAYDPAHGRAIVFGGVDETDRAAPIHHADTWSLRFSRFGDQACTFGGGTAGVDMDRDGLVGCADPDCWAYCTPTCAPNSTADWPAGCDTNEAHCGDGVCDPDLEDCGLCPGDCGDCEACGDYVCDGTEDMASCPGDCS